MKVFRMRTPRDFGAFAREIPSPLNVLVFRNIVFTVNGAMVMTLHFVESVHMIDLFAVLAVCVVFVLIRSGTSDLLKLGFRNTIAGIAYASLIGIPFGIWLLIIQHHHILLRCIGFATMITLSWLFRKPLSVTWVRRRYAKDYGLVDLKAVGFLVSSNVEVKPFIHATLIQSNSELHIFNRVPDEEWEGKISSLESGSITIERKHSNETVKFKDFQIGWIYPSKRFDPDKSFKNSNPK